MDWKERKKCDERQRRTSELQFAHKYKEILILNILLKRRVNYVHSCFACARIVFLFSLMDKSKSKSKRFSPYCFSFVVLGIWNSNTASTCCHIAFHLLYSEFETRSTASACCHNALHLLYSEFWLRSRKWKTDENIKWSSDLLQ